MRLVPHVNGTTICVFPSSGLITVEARLAVVLAGQVDDHSLIPATRLAEGAERARAAVESLGVAVAEPATVRRLDLAAELRFGRGTDGLSFLNACQRGLHLPRLRQIPHHAIGDARLESIVWATEKTKQTRARLYDAGSRHKTHPPGERLRLERQQRWARSAAPTAEQAMGLDLSAIYAAPFSAWLRRSTSIRVHSGAEAIASLFQQARDGERTRQNAESLSAKVNSLVFAPDLLAPHDRRRRVRDLRAAGIALDRSGDTDSTPVDLGDQLRALARTWESA